MAIISMLIVQATILTPSLSAFSIISVSASTFFFFMTYWIILDPSPNMFMLEIGSLEADFGIIMLNALSRPDFSFFGAFGSLMTLSPQNVKNMVTSLPMLFAPVAMMNEASALSRSPLNTTIVAPSFVATI